MNPTTADDLGANSIFSQGGGYNIPDYFYTPRENLFNSLQVRKDEPLNPKFFILTEPDDRVAK